MTNANMPFREKTYARNSPELFQSVRYDSSGDADINARDGGW